MTAPLWNTSNLPLLGEPSDASTGRLCVVPWSKFGTRRLYVNTADGRQVGWVDLKTGHRTLAMPELAPAFEIALSEADDAPADVTDSSPPRRAFDDAIDLALMAGHAALRAHDSTPADDHPADEPTGPMRHAYRGKQAYSAWDLGAPAKRLVEEPDEPVSLDPRRAYLNSTSVSN